MTMCWHPRMDSPSSHCSTRERWHGDPARAAPAWPCFSAGGTTLPAPQDALPSRASLLTYRPGQYSRAVTTVSYVLCSCSVCSGTTVQQALSLPVECREQPEWGLEQPGGLVSARSVPAVSLTALVPQGVFFSCLLPHPRGSVMTTTLHSLSPALSRP